ncbi:MAG: damage-inducible protein DinB [Microscillaceae bacterium]|nr:damage-inducible protein DinB [Microscillaceae bacterium]
MQDLFTDLFAYQHHFNQAIGEQLGQAREELLTEALPLFAHLINAHHTWNARLLGHTPEVKVFEVHPLLRCLQMDRDNYANTLKAMAKYEFNRVIDYQTSKGEPFRNTVRDILFHIVNHSTHHRAQISTQLRQAGISPLATDYIFFRRKARLPHS